MKRSKDKMTTFKRIKKPSDAKYPKSLPVPPPMTAAQYARARAQGDRLMRSPLALVEARYDEAEDALFFQFRNGSTISLPRKLIWELKGARPSDLRRVEIQPTGDAFSIRKLDVDIYLPGLIADEFAELFARGLGQKARGKTSEKKARSSALNGKRGGRPRTRPTSPAEGRRSGRAGRT